MDRQLSNYLNEFQKTKRKYTHGENCCVSFLFGAIKAVQGSDYFNHPDYVEYQKKTETEICDMRPDMENFISGVIKLPEGDALTMVAVAEISGNKCAGIIDSGYFITVNESGGLHATINYVAIKKWALLYR